MSLISVKNLTFAYDGSPDNVFENAEMLIDTSWKLGLVGRNGRGKTTLLRLLTGDFSYSGTITSGSDVTFEYFPIDLKSKDTSVSAMDFALHIAPGVEEWEILRELNLLAFDTDRVWLPFETLSYGERTKIMLAALFCKNNAFLLIDEPTNHLDTAGRKVLTEYLNGKSGFILVSHDRQVLDECTDHTISINRADIDVVQGNFSVWEQNKAYRDAFELSENEKLKKDIKRLEESARRASQWSIKTEKSKKGAADRGFIGHKAAKMMSKAKNIEDRKNTAISEKQSLLKNIENADALKISPLRYVKQTLIFARDLQIAYDWQPIFAPLSFTIENGDRAVLSGKNGCGKSSLIKLILGKTADELTYFDTFSGTYAGVLEIGSNLKISYVPQGTEHLHGFLRDYAEQLDIDESLFKSILRKLNVDRSQFDKDIVDFSEGQKKKVLLAGSLCEKAHIYIWDEPLNFIDVLSHRQIEDLILESCPTILFVEHDTSFTKRIATKEILL
jgi:lincosamide and streptogramin A transport system ATP-binding/permease protein